jgi:hypothetical protein
MKPTKKLSRRSFLGRVAGGAIAGGAALTILGETPAYAQVTDTDTGRYADPVGRGRGRRGSGVTDSDTGRYADPAGNGRGRRRRCTGLTDADRGSWADPADCGRGRRNR